MKEGYSSMNHKRLAAALLTALALTTLPAMGTAFAEDGVDAYGRPDAAARTQQENPPVTVSITPSDTQEPSENTAEETQEPAPQEEENNKTVKMQTSLFPPFPQARPIKAKALSSPSTYSLPKQSPNPSTTLSSLQ